MSVDLAVLLLIAVCVVCATVAAVAFMVTQADSERARALEDAVDELAEARMVGEELAHSAGMTTRDRLLATSLRERYVITLTDGTSFDGLLWDVDDQVLELRDAQAFDEQGRRHKVDGAMVVLRGRVAYLQRPSTATAAGE